MEFIPLEQSEKKRKKVEKTVKNEEGHGKRFKEKSENDEYMTQKKGKLRKLPMKNVKNQYKEKILEKRIQKSSLKKSKKSILKKVIEKEEDCEDDTQEDNNFGSKEEMNSDEEEDEEYENHDSDDKEEKEEEEGEEDEEEEMSDDKEDEEKRQENAKREKWKKMDEKKKNRLFVKMKKKIYSESQIKELHPDIKGVIFPRKKNPRWCWAVFVSEESANKAFNKLIKNKEIFIGKPNTMEQVERKREKKMATIKKKEQAKKKHLKMWT